MVRFWFTESHVQEAGVSEKKLYIYVLMYICMNKTGLYNSQKRFFSCCMFRIVTWFCAYLLIKLNIRACAYGCAELSWSNFINFLRLCVYNVKQSTRSIMY